MAEAKTENGTENTDTERPYIDLRRCQSMLDKYKAALRQKQQQEQQDQTAAEPEGTSSSSTSDVHPAGAGPVTDDAQQRDADDTPGTDSAAAAAAAAAAIEAGDRRSYVDWDTMQKMAKNAATENSSVVNGHSGSSEGSQQATPENTEQPIYASVKKLDRASSLDVATGTVNSNGETDTPTATTTTTETTTTADVIVVYEKQTTISVEHNFGDGVYSKITWPPDIDETDSSTIIPEEGTDKNDVTVTSDGVVVPVRFVVRFIGSVPMSNGKLDAPVSRAVRRLCRRKDDDTAELPSDVVRYWPTDVDLTLELSGKYLRLVDSSEGSEVFSQRLNAVRQWSSGPDSHSRHFTYVSREPTGTCYACHVFRCLGDCCADDVTSTLRRVCSEMQRLREETIHR